MRNYLNQTFGIGTAIAQSSVKVILFIVIGGNMSDMNQVVEVDVTNLSTGSELNAFSETEDVIQRNAKPAGPIPQKSDVYDRARELYSRARTRHQSKSASIL